MKTKKILSLAPVFAGFAISACLLTAASSAKAGPLFTTTTPAFSPVGSFQQSQEDSGASTGSNQALMSQMINQLNMNQMQSNVTIAQGAAQRAMFEPQQTISFRHAK
jgi:hypothetical protein